MADNPFATFGLPTQFAVDRAALHRAYLAMTSAHHPDVSEDLEAAEARSAALNAARESLEDPEKRAGVLLNLLGERHGITFSPQDVRALPDGFLLDMMDTREQMEDAARTGDRVQIERWRAWAEGRRGDHQRRIAELFRQLECADAHRDGPAPVPTVLRAIRLELNAWRYIERMLEQLDSQGETSPAM